MSPEYAMTRNETQIPEMMTAVISWPVGNAGPAKVNS